MTSFSRCSPRFRKVGSRRAGASGGRGTGGDRVPGAGGRAGRGRDGQHLGQLSARGPGPRVSAGRALPPQCTAAPGGRRRRSRLSSSLVPAPARRRRSAASTRAGRTEGEAGQKGSCLCSALPVYTTCSQRCREKACKSPVLLSAEQVLTKARGFRFPGAGATSLCAA